jgi:hypothetical protein
MPESGPPAAVSLYRMAEALQIDLAEALLEGKLDGATLLATRARCEACGAVGACGAWLAGAGTAAAPPGFCPNAAVLGALRG